jgi:hypothetical protein
MKTINYKAARNGNGPATKVMIPENHLEAAGTNIMGLVIAAVLLLALAGFVCLLLRA